MTSHTALCRSRKPSNHKSNANQGYLASVQMYSSDSKDLYILSMLLIILHLVYSGCLWALHVSSVLLMFGGDIMMLLCKTSDALDCFRTNKKLISWKMEVSINLSQNLLCWLHFWLYREWWVNTETWNLRKGAWISCFEVAEPWDNDITINMYHTVIFPYLQFI